MTKSNGKQTVAGIVEYTPHQSESVYGNKDKWITYTIRKSGHAKIEDHVEKFHFITRAGMNCEKQTKTNQDSLFVVKNFAKVEGMWYFGVCDGHG